MSNSNFLKKLSSKFKRNKMTAENLTEQATKFSCNSQFGVLQFWDTQKPHKSYDPESIKSNETDEMKGEPYDFRDLVVEAGDVILDIGAHVGTVTVYLAKMFPEAKIYAFEPMPSNFECLEKNIKENGLSNVVAVNAAVTKDGRDLEFTYRLALGQSQTPHMSASKIHKENDSSHELVQLDVKSVSLDEFFNEFGVDKVALLKIDCEGAEYEVLYNLDALSRVSNVRGELHSSVEENDALINYLDGFDNIKSIRFTRNKSGEEKLSGFVYHPVS